MIHPPCNALLTFLVAFCSASFLFAQSSDIQPGDQIRVTADAAKVMAGETVLGSFPKGTELTIDKIQNGWGLIRITVGGEAKTGWIKLSEVGKTGTSAPGTGGGVAGKKLRFAAREAAELKAGDTMVVTHPEGTKLWVDDYAIKDSTTGEGYIIPPDTRLKLEVNRDRPGSLFVYQTTLNYQGKSYTGAIEKNHITRLQEYLAGERRRDRYAEDKQRMHANMRRNMPRMDVARDFPGKLYGTTDIKQGFFRKAPTVLNEAEFESASHFLTYFNLAKDDSDFGVTRESDTEQLLKAAATAPTADELLTKIRAFIEGDLKPLTDEESDQVDQFRSQIRGLRATGDYAGAEKIANELTAWCDEHVDKSSPLAIAAKRQLVTIGRIQKLPKPAQAELAEADAASGIILARYQAGLFVAPLLWTRDQYEVRRQYLGDDDFETITSAIWLAQLHRLGCLALPEQMQAGLALRVRRLFGDQDSLVALCLNNLALVRWDRADHSSAELLLRQAIANSLQTPGGEQHQMALLLSNFGKVLEGSGKLTEAQPWFELSRRLTRKLPRRERERVAASLLNELDATADDAPLALQGGVAFRPNRIFHVAYGVNAQFGNMYEPNAFAVPQTGDLDITSLASTGNSMLGLMKFDREQELQNAGSMYLLSGDITNAERLLREAAILTRQKLKTGIPSSQVAGSVMSLVSFAMVLQSVGNHEEAVSTMSEAVTYDRRVWTEEMKAKREELARLGGTDEIIHAPSNVYMFGPLLQYYGQILLGAGNGAEAERVFREALEVTRVGEELSEKIREHTNRVISVNTKMDPIYARGGFALRNLAEALEVQDKLAEAERVYRQAMKSECDAWIFNNDDQPTRLWTGLGNLLLKTGQASRLPEAGPMLRDGMWFAHRRRHLPGYTRVLGGTGAYVSYADYLRRVSRPAEAMHVLAYAIHQIDEARKQSGGDDLDRARAFSNLLADNPYRDIIRLQLDMGADFADGYGIEQTGANAAFDYLEQGRGRALLDLLGRGGQDVVQAALELAGKQSNSLLLDRVKAVQKEELAARTTVAQLNQQMVAARQAAAADPVEGSQRLVNLQQSIKEAGEAERQAKRELFNIAREALTSQQTQPFSAAEVSSLLKDGELLLAFDVGPKDSVLLIVRPSSKVEGRFLKWPNDKPVTLETLSGTVAEFFDEVSRETNEAPADSTTVDIYDPAALRQTLLSDSLLQGIQKASRLFIIADGPLHRLPFETLFADAEGKAVVLDTLPPVVYGPSATVLLKDRKLPPVEKPSLARQLVAIGDPAFSRGTEGTPADTNADAKLVAAVEARTRTLSGFGTLAPLHGTRGEVNAIATLVRKLPGANDDSLRLLTGKEATVTNVFQETNRPRFLHLATHGLAEGGRKAYESALALAAPSQVTADDTGFLRLADLLYKWGGKLQGTELVTLSACRTARGQMESGDGFVALTWGFLYAGTKAVVASLWEVDDTSTALLMSRFYENLLGTFEQPRKIGDQTVEPKQPIPPALALRDAKLWLRNLSRDDATAHVKKLLGDKGRVPSGDRPFADPFYWGAFVLIGNSD